MDLSEDIADLMFEDFFKTAWILTTLVNIAKNVFEFIGNLKNYSRNKSIVSGICVWHIAWSRICRTCEYSTHTEVWATWA